MDINTWMKKYWYAIGAVALLVLVGVISMMNRPSTFLLPESESVVLSHEPVPIPTDRKFDFTRVPNQVTRATFERSTETHPLWPELSLNGRVFGLNLTAMPQLEISNPQTAARMCNVPQTSLLMDRAIMNSMMICAEYDGPLTTTYAWAHSSITPLEWVKETTMINALEQKESGWKNTDEQVVTQVGAEGDITFFETRIGSAPTVYRAVTLFETEMTRNLGVRVVLDVTATLGDNPEQSKKLVASHMIRLKSTVTETEVSY
jgi:hypothetical protein